MGFGDLSKQIPQRSASIPGGLRIEAGCWTSTSDASAHIPTQLTEIVAFVGVCGSATAVDLPDISAGYIQCAFNGAGNTIINYVAVGY